MTAEMKDWILVGFLCICVWASYALESCQEQVVRMDPTFAMSQPVQPPVKALRVWPDSAWRRKGDPR